MLTSKHIFQEKTSNYIPQSYTMPIVNGMLLNEAWHSPEGASNITLRNGQIIPIIKQVFIFNNYNSSPILGDNTVDGPMLVLHYKGNLDINTGVLLTPQVRRKGLLVIVDGILTNNGTISMTARGANAAGQDIQLYLNTDDSIEFIPAIGAAGGTAVSTYNNNGVAYGRTGPAGINRQTGGGSSGASCHYAGTNGTATSGAGAPGSSYSGGPGGGGVVAQSNVAAGAGAANGGIGGYANSYPGIGATQSYSAGGGAGNPGGAQHNSKGPGSEAGGNGTGGLLLLLVKDFNNRGIIEAKGIKGGNSGSGLGGGGSSGGGSINIFCKTIINEGTITAQGGPPSGGYGSYGGDGYTGITLLN